METASLIDPALGALELIHEQAADAILDFRESALSRTNAGRCINSYFNILGAARDDGARPISVLRNWIERHVIIVVSDERSRELERLPVHLESENLQSFCHRVLTVMWLDRAYQNTSFEFRFEYADAIAA